MLLKFYNFTVMPLTRLCMQSRDAGLRLNLLMIMAMRTGAHPDVSTSFVCLFREVK